MSTLTPVLEDRFWAKVDGGSYSDCWNWIRARDKRTGYGVFAVGNKKQMRAPRLSHELFIAAIPESLSIDHLCFNRACVNPWHLDPVTHLENMHRGDVNHNKTHCPRGHEYTEANTYRTSGRRYCRACRAIHAGRAA